MEELQGGREGLIFRSEDKVYRPSGFWSVSIHKLLSHLESEALMVRQNHLVSMIMGMRFYLMCGVMFTITL